MKQVVQRELQRLSFDVPERHVEGTLAMDLFTPRRVEPIHVHVMPDLLDVERALPDEAACKILDQIGRAAFADAGDADIGLDGHEHAALVERAVHGTGGTSISRA